MSAHNRTGKVTLCGIFCGLAVAILAVGCIFPAATFCAPAIAGLCAVPVAVEFGMKAGLMVYLVSSVLSIFFCPDPEATCIFIFFLGYYPLVKPKLDKIKRKPLRVAAKTVLFQLAVFACYGLLLLLLPAAQLTTEMKQAGIVLLLGMLVMGNICFWVYDRALVNLFRIYMVQLRPKLFSSKHQL